MQIAAMVSLLVFGLAVAAQLVVERLMAFPIAPARMLVVAVGAVCAAPISVALAERLVGRLATLWRVIVALVAPAILLGVFLAAVRLSGGPLGPIPGGRLGGRLADGDLEVSVLDRTKYVQLEMHGPRSVELIVVRVGEDAFVGANHPEWKVWPDVVAAHPDVVLRVDDVLYARRAVEITDTTRSRELLDAMSRKYKFDVSLGTGYVRFFRLDAP